jgi:6-phosphogluconolactonase
MPDVLYVGLQDDDKIAAFTIAADGGLAPLAETPVAGGPSVFALSPDRRTLYVGHRTTPAISAWRIDAGGGLLPLATAAMPDPPTFLAPDRTGRYLLSAYYQGGYAAVHALLADGSLGSQRVDQQMTAVGAHAIATDPSNRYAYVPHIARLQDNVLEPPRDNPGPNFIMQFRFDPASGRLSPNNPARIGAAELQGPRHYCFHPSLDIAYFSNEQGCGVSAYRLDRGTGTLSHIQTISSLPPGFGERNTCSQIHLTPSGRLLYVGNRGHNSIAGFMVDPSSGQLTAAGHAATERVPNAFGLDPGGRFLYATGSASGQLAAYRIDVDTGALTPLMTRGIGQRPAAVQAVRVGG